MHFSKRLYRTEVSGTKKLVGAAEKEKFPKKPVLPS